jgi:hypothetical protein
MSDFILQKLDRLQTQIYDLKRDLSPEAGFDNVTYAVLFLFFTITCFAVGHAVRRLPSVCRAACCLCFLPYRLVFQVLPALLPTFGCLGTRRLAIFTYIFGGNVSAPSLSKPCEKRHVSVQISPPVANAGVQCSSLLMLPLAGSTPSVDSVSDLSHSSASASGASSDTVINVGEVPPVLAGGQDPPAAGTNQSSDQVEEVNTIETVPLDSQPPTSQAAPVGQNGSNQAVISVVEDDSNQVPPSASSLTTPGRQITTQVTIHPPPCSVSSRLSCPGQSGSAAGAETAEGESYFGRMCNTALEMFDQSPRGGRFKDKS